MALMGSMSGLSVGVACTIKIESGEIAVESDDLAASPVDLVVCAAASDADEPKE